jgi:ribosomal protein S18 acetylase RimI-like enzyme
MAQTSPQLYRIRHGRAADVALLGDIERSAGQVFRTVGLDAVADDEPMPPEVLRRYMEMGLLLVAVAVRSIVGSDNGDEGQERSEQAVCGEGTNSEDVIGKEQDRVVGFLACFPIIRQDAGRATEDPAAGGPKSSYAHLHIAELSVHASHQRRGLGKRLLQTMFAEMKRRPYVSLPPHPKDEQDPSDEPSKEGQPLSEAAKKAQRVPLKGYSLTTYIHLSFNAPFYETMGFRLLNLANIGENVGTRATELWEEEQRSIAMPEKRCWMLRGLYP